MLDLEAGALYAVLTWSGERASWHWLFFLPDPTFLPVGTQGTTFRVVNKDSGAWEYEVDERNIVQASETVACIKLTSVNDLGTYPVVANFLEKTLQSVPVDTTIQADAFSRTSFSCRRWSLHAIRALHEYGIVNCPSVSGLEQDIKRFAVEATAKYMDEGGFMVCASAACS